MKPIQRYAALAFIATVITGSAAVINITVGPDGVGLQNGGDDSMASNAFYSSIVGSKSNDKASNLLFLQTVIANWNISGNTPPMLPATSSATMPGDNDDIGDTSSFTSAAGYDYVVFHVGNGQAGEKKNADESGWWVAWYLGGESNTFVLPQEGLPPEDTGGFSSARYFNASQDVPDGGGTLLSLGIAILGLSGVRRFLTKA